MLNDSGIDWYQQTEIPGGSCEETEARNGPKKTPTRDNPVLGSPCARSGALRSEHAFGVPAGAERSEHPRPSLETTRGGTKEHLEHYYPPAAGMPAFATDYQYNLDKQLLQETRPDAVVTNRSYDTAGRLDLLTMPTGALDYSYYPAGCTTAGCAPGKLASIAGPGAETLAFTYDGQLQKSMSWTCPSGANALPITRDPQNALLTGTS